MSQRSQSDSVTTREQVQRSSPNILTHTETNTKTQTTNKSDEIVRMLLADKPPDRQSDTQTSPDTQSDKHKRSYTPDPDKFRIRAKSQSCLTGKEGNLALGVNRSSVNSPGIIRKSRTKSISSTGNKTKGDDINGAKFRSVRDMILVFEANRMGHNTERIRHDTSMIDSTPERLVSAPDGEIQTVPDPGQFKPLRQGS